MKRDRQMVIQFPKEIEDDLRVFLVLHGANNV